MHLWGYLDRGHEGGKGGIIFEGLSYAVVVTVVPEVRVPRSKRLRESIVCQRVVIQHVLFANCDGRSRRVNGPLERHRRVVFASHSLSL